jgi:hypothetical protein
VPARSEKETGGPLAQTARKNNSREECRAYGAPFLRGWKIRLFISTMMMETVRMTKSIVMEFCNFCIPV